MYGIVLIIHSWLRWAVLAAGIASVARGGAPGSSTGRWFTILLDVQMLIGLLLYFVLSPFTTAALGDFGGAMKIPQLRFFAVEHTFGMVIALALAHIGTAKIKKVPTERRPKLAMIFYGLALVAILVSIPWPGMPAGRPLFRF